MAVSIFRGYNVADLIKGMEGRRFGFEEITYLLLFGSLPTEPQLNDFNEILKYLPRAAGHFLSATRCHEGNQQKRSKILCSAV